MIFTRGGAIGGFVRNEFAVYCEGHGEITGFFGCMAKHYITWASGCVIWNGTTSDMCLERGEACFEYSGTGIVWGCKFNEDNMTRTVYGRTMPVIRAGEFLRGVMHDDIY